MAVKPNAPCALGRERHRWNPGRRPSRQRCSYCGVNRAEWSKRYRFSGRQRVLQDLVTYGLAVRT